MSTDLAPPRSRIDDIDALRGFALLGILVVNITFAASGFPIHVADDPAYQSTLDHTVHRLSATFVDMKFYLLFSFLFGYSFQLQMEAAQRAGAAFKPRMQPAGSGGADGPVELPGPVGRHATDLHWSGVRTGREVSPLETFGFALAIFTVQVAISHWWMARYGYGPVEGVLRAITNATPPSWKKKIST